MITSSLDADGVTTVPAEVVEALGLKPGDFLRYAIEDGQIRVSRADEDVGDFSDDELAPFIDEALAAFERDGKTFTAEEVFAALHERIEALSGRRDAA